VSTFIVRGTEISSFSLGLSLCKKSKFCPVKVNKGEEEKKLWKVKTRNERKFSKVCKYQTRDGKRENVQMEKLLITFLLEINEGISIPSKLMTHDAFGYFIITSNIE
jgi:hypothetical protein